MQLDESNQYRPRELDNVTVAYSEGERIVTCFCGDKVSRSIVPHLKTKHPEEWNEWTIAFIKLHAAGYPLKRIMRTFRAGDGKLLFSWTVIERAIRAKVESGEAEYSPPPKKKIEAWHPPSFMLERTTVWDFPQRGSWAVHTGDYRGNWPPQIPRNLLLKYTKKGDLVVDAFVGGGTTLIEAWLLGRRSIGFDVSRLAIQYTKARITEMEKAAQENGRPKPKVDYKPQAELGDALQLCDNLLEMGVHQGEVRLVCAHPPYLDSIRYTRNNLADLASIKVPDIFYKKMRLFAKQAKKCLAPDGVCAVLIGDVKKKGITEPLGLRTLDCFLNEDFSLESIIVKKQHRDRSSEFYFRKDNTGLLMAHEYLFILRNK